MFKLSSIPAIGLLAILGIIVCGVLWIVVNVIIPAGEAMAAGLTF